MKNLFVTFLVLASSTILYGQSTVTGLISSKGIAPIPSFGLDEPAALILADLKLTKNFHFMPDIAFGLESGGKGWFLDNWIKWIQPLDTTNNWSVSVGVDWSLFFQPFVTDGDGGKEITQAVIYPTFELAGGYIQDSTWSTGVAYWYSYAIESQYGVAGHYVTFNGARTWHCNPFALSLKANPFWISFNDGAKGWSIAGLVTGTHKPSGLFLGLQGIQPLTLDFKFNWNISLGITRRLL